jgi:DNA-binding response OmpR family regulator
MNVLIADDDVISRRVLQGILEQWGYAVTVTCDGEAAWQALRGKSAPAVALLDWNMPGLDGTEVCRRVRAASERPVYLILITSRTTKEDLVAGLESGADDYLSKPFDRAELRARIRVGERILQLQQNLSERVRQLEEAVRHIKQLQGLIPICSYCKRVRNDGDSWQQIEAYIAAHSEAHFSHGICPDCWDSEVQPQLDALEKS